MRWFERPALNTTVCRGLGFGDEFPPPLDPPSAGGFSISQKMPEGVSNSRPSNQETPSTTEIVSTILPFLLRPLEINSTTTGVSFSSRSGRITPHPCALTTVVSYFPEKLCAGSRLVITIGIWRERRVLRLTSFLRSSAVPSLGLNAYWSPDFILWAVEEMARFQDADLRKPNKMVRDLL